MWCSPLSQQALGAGYVLMQRGNCTQHSRKYVSMQVALMRCTHASNTSEIML